MRRGCGGRGRPRASRRTTEGSAGAVGWRTHRWGQAAPRATGLAVRGTRVAGPRHRGLVAAAAAAARPAAAAAAAAAKSSRAFAAAAAVADAGLAPPPGVKGRSAPAGGAGGRGRGGASPGGLGGEPAAGPTEGGEGAGKPRARATPLVPAPRARAPRPGPAPAGASPANQRPTDLHNTERPAPAPPCSRGQNGLYAATTWREGKGAKMEGEGRGACGRRELGGEPPGGRMGRGVSIQTQTITKPSKAARGRLCGSSSEVFGSRARAGAKQVAQRRRAVGASGEEARRPAAGVGDDVCGDGDEGGLSA